MRPEARKVAMTAFSGWRNRGMAPAMAKSLFIITVFLMGSLHSHAAVAWVSASHSVCAQTSSSVNVQSCPLAAATISGDDVVVGVAWQNNGSTIANVYGSGPTSYFSLYGAVCNSGAQCVATLVCHNCAAQSSVTTTMSSGTEFVTTVEEYSGVQALGITGANTSISATPGLAMTIGDANDFTVCATSSPGNDGVPSAGTGVLRDANSTGTTPADIAGAIVDNTAASAGSAVTCADTITPDAWAATGIELRSVAPRTYIWPDCDTSHPCIVHHIDTVAAGTAEGEAPNGFNVTTVPSSPGNLLTFTVTHVSTKTISVSDNNGGNWQTAVTTANASDQVETDLLYVCGAAAGTNVITIQLSEPPASGEVLQFSYNEVSGITASSCLDGAATGANGLTGNLQPGPLVTSADGDLIYNFAEESFNYPENDDPIGWVMPDDNSALLMENTFDKFASQVSVQAAHGTYNPTLYENSDLNDRNWNSVAAAFMPSIGSGTQPTGIHITRVMHYYNPSLPLTPSWIAFPSTGNALVISSAYPSSGYEGDMTDVADNQGDTWTRTPFSIPDGDPQIYYTCLGPEASSRDLTINWLPDTGTTHMIVYDIAGAFTGGGPTGCVGATVNSEIGTQPPYPNASILGAPVITPQASNSVVIAVNQMGIGPPSGSLTPGAVFTSIWAAGMIDATNWDSGDCYGYIYPTTINPISFDWQMANANGVPDGSSGYDSAAIEILPAVPAQFTPTVTVTPGSASITTIQALSVTVAVNGGTGNPTPTGSVTLASGSYTSGATALSGGSATITIPAGSLAPGNDTLSANYAPDANSSSTYTTASGTAATAVSVILATPTIAWNPASTIIFGDPGSTDVLDASANVSGSFTYSATPTAGGATTDITGGTSALAAGSYNIAANFAPANPSVYGPAQSTATLVVSSVSVWIGNSTGGIGELAGDGAGIAASADLGAILAVAVDNNGNVWTVGSGSTSLEETNQTGTVLNSIASGTGGLSSPAGIAIDGNGQVWIPNGANSVSLFSNAGAALSPANGFTDASFSAPDGIAVDSGGSVWIANKGNNSVTRILGGAAPAAPLAAAAANKTTGEKP
jgi:hypothetical protein